MTKMELYDVYSTLSRFSTTVSLHVNALRDIKWRPEKDLALVKRAVITHVFAFRTVLAQEEVLLSMCQNSRVIIFRVNGKTQ